MKEKLNYIDVIRNSGIILLLFVVNTIIITNLLFFINISITIFNIIISAIITTVEFCLIKKQKSNLKQMLASIILAIVLILLTLIVSSQTYDLSWDGNTYHKTAIGSLKNGWNPVYEKVENFTTEKGNKINIDEEEQNKTWVNHYPKASWIFAANIYKLTNNIETAKILNILIMYIGFSLIFTYLSKRISKLLAFIIAILLVCNPISVGQVFNYYIDGLLSISLFIIICSLLAITEYRKNKEEDNKFILKEHFVILAYAIIFIINLKFTGLVYAGIFCFLFYLYWLYQSYKDGNLKEYLIKYTSFYAIVVIFAVIIVGYSPYVKNFIEKGHPFYPLFGEGKLDIITFNQPQYFKERNVIEKFMITMFSEGSNVHDSYGDNNEKPHLKIPFTIKEGELKEYARPDTRISGFGPLYSGIFIISCIVTLCMIIKYWKNKNWNTLMPFLLLLAGMLFLILATDGSWWARYTPYLYLLPIFNVIFLWQEKGKLGKVLSGILMILLIINISLIIHVNASTHLEKYGNIKNTISNFEKYVNENENINVSLRTTGFEGIKYNISDLNINTDKINYVEKIKGKKNNVYFFTYQVD